MDNYMNEMLIKLDKLYGDRNMHHYKELLDMLESRYPQSSELLIYYIIYYWSTYKLDQSYPFIKKYVLDQINKDGNKQFLYPLKELLPTLMYEDILSDDEYIDLIQYVCKLSIPESENKIIPNDPSFFKTIKVGLLSYDLRYHPVGLFLMALFNDKLNFNTIQYFVYDTYGSTNDIQKSISIAVTRYCDVSEYDNSTLAEFIQNDSLDILIDLSGLSEKNKLDIFPKRLAPIQISWIGFPGTTACYNMDYVIVDRITDPLEISEKYYTEKLLYLEHTFLCFIHNNNKIIKNTTPALVNNFITFGSFVNPHKYSIKILKIWAKILELIPNSKIIIQSSFFKSNEDIQIQMDKFSHNGINLSQVVFLRASGYHEYIENYNSVDIILDTYPFNGATTTCEALSCGVPVITLAGNMHASRVGASILTNIGRKDLIAYNEESYVSKVIELSNHIQKLNLLRNTIRNNFINSPLSDHLSFKIDFENMLRNVYVNYLMEYSIPISKIETWTPQKITIEVICSIYYIKYLIDHNQTKNLFLIIYESTNVQIALLNILISSYSNNKNALELLKRYSTLINLLTTEINIVSIKIILDSILKIISKFIS